MKKSPNITNGINSKTWTQEDFDEIRHLVEIESLKNQISKPVITFESNDGTRITKSAGYIPVKRQIEILQDSGKRLELMREGTYDYQDENFSFDVNDPTRRLNFDLADASELQKATNKEIKKQQRENYLRRVGELAKLHEEKELTQKVSMGDNINKEESPKESTKSEAKK